MEKLIVDYSGESYEFVPDNSIGGCNRCAGNRDPVLCGYLGAHCDGGYFIEKRGPGRPRKE